MIDEVPQILRPCALKTNLAGKSYGRIEMMNTFKKHLEQYITMHSGCLRYTAREANGWGKKKKETGGPLYGLFTQARRVALMLAGPGGPNSCHEEAHFAMDADYVTALNLYIQENFGGQPVGNWHSHILDMDHASDGDVNNIHRLASRNNLETMVQLVLTRQKVATAHEQTARFDSIKKRLSGTDDHVRIKVNAFIYERAATGPYLRVPIKILPGESFIREALADTGILDIPGAPVFKDFPLERIVCDEVKSRPGTATAQYIPYILTKQLNELATEIARQTEICSYDKDRVVLSLPLSSNHRVSVTYAVKESPPRICSVGVFYPDTKTVIDFTKDILMKDEYAALSLIHRLVEQKVRESKIERLTPVIRGCRYFASKLHKDNGIQ